MTADEIRAIRDGNGKLARTKGMDLEDAMLIEIAAQLAEHNENLCQLIRVVGALDEKLFDYFTLQEAEK